MKPSITIRSTGHPAIVRIVRYYAIFRRGPCPPLGLSTAKERRSEGARRRFSLFDASLSTALDYGYGQPAAKCRVRGGELRLIAGASQGRRAARSKSCSAAEPLVASIRLQIRSVGPAALDACRLLGKPLPLLGHFDQKRLVLGVGRFARLFQAPRCKSLVCFRGRHAIPGSSSTERRARLFQHRQRLRIQKCEP